MSVAQTEPRQETKRDSQQEPATDRRAGAALIDAALFIEMAPEAGLQIMCVDGHEELGRLFSYTIHVASIEPLVEERIVGSKAELTIALDGQARVVRGLISECAYDSAGRDDYYYVLTLSPPTWRLTQRVNCRVFNDLTTEQIVEKIFADHGLIRPAFKFALQGDYKPRNYCVQYGESDWDFVSRLLEEEGMYHFQREEQGAGVLYITDGPHGHLDCPLAREAKFHAPEGMIPDVGVVYEFQFRRQIRPGKVSQTDYAAGKPAMPLATTVVADPKDAEVFVFPGEYRDKELGQRLGQVRLDELRTGGEQGRGRSTRVDFAPGYRFLLAGHPVPAFNRGFLITRLRTRVRSPMAAERGYVPAGVERKGDEIRPACENEFLVIPVEQTFRPKRSTPRPAVRGPQTATVVGPRTQEDGNPEIYTDKLGRVKVQFRWDREGKSDEASSCWVRVNQPWAGGGFGGVFIPRVGQEVIVDFLEGDPDQPIVVGRVYNGNALPPLDLPKQKACTAFKSNSTPGGGGYNEIRFDDTKDNEKFSIHAQRDMDTTVRRNSSLKVTKDREIKVDGTHTETIKGLTKVTITDGNHEFAVKSGTSTETIKGDTTLTISNGKLTRTVARDVSDTFKANHTEKVTAEYGLEARKVKIIGKQEITLSVGSNYIKIDQAGVTVFGTLVKIN